MYVALREPVREPVAHSVNLPRLATFCTVAAALAVFAYAPPDTSAQIDDAFIAYRYADHLAHGLGLTYNAGDRVEGFTSLLWVLLVAGGVRLGFAAPAVSQFFGILFGAAALVASFAYARVALAPKQRWLAALAPWLLVSSTAFSYWMTSGLETPLFVAAVTAALLLDSRERRADATLAACVATLTRPEGVLVALVVLTSAMANHGEWRRLRSWRLPLLYGAFVMAITAFRLVYFGSPLPNTFYAKVGDVPAAFTLHYAVSFVIQIFAPLAVPFAIGVVREPKLRNGAIWAGVVFVYVAVVGADFAEHSRFFLPALPAIIALALRGVAECADCRSPWPRLVVACLPAALVWYLWGPLTGSCGLLVAAALAVAVGGPMTARSWIATAAIGVLVAAAGSVAKWPLQPALPKWMGGKWAPRVVLRRGAELARLRKENEALTALARLVNDRLKHRRPAVGSVASMAIGVLGYESSLRVVDIYGLTDAVIARSETKSVAPDFTVSFPGHLRSNPDRIFALKPDCILIPRDHIWLPVPAHIALLVHPELARSYAWDPFLQAYCVK
jgi:hypothetical protein